MEQEELNPSLLILTQYYPPETGAPQARLSSLAKSLQQNGFRISVLTAMPSYPFGKIFPGYTGISRKEKVDGVDVKRSYIIATKKTSLIPRLTSYFSFCISSFVSSLTLPTFDYVITESPPLFLGITGLLISKIKRARWILNVSDLWPLSAAELNVIVKDSWGYRISEKIERYLYQNAWLITGQSRSILENIQSRFPYAKVYHLSNGSNPDDFQFPHGSTDKTNLTVLYAGLHGLAQGLEQIIEAARILQVNSEIRFQLVGDGPTKPALIELVNKYGLNNVDFLNAVSREKIPQILANADVILVPLRTELTGAVPSKLYEAMAAGKPVIYIGSGEAGEIILNNECGYVIPPGKLDQLVDAIETLFADPERRKTMGANGRNVVVQFFDRQKIGWAFARYLLMSKKNDG